MKKDTNIRIFPDDWKILKQLSIKEGRTLKSMFRVVINHYKKHEVPN